MGALYKYIVQPNLPSVQQEKKANYPSLCSLDIKDIFRNSPRYCYPSLCTHPEHLSVEQCNLQGVPVDLQHLLLSQEGNLTLCRDLKKQTMGSSPGELQKVLLGKNHHGSRICGGARSGEVTPEEIQAGTKEIGLLTSVLREDSFHSPSPSFLSSPPRFSSGSVMNKASPLDIIYNTHHASTT